MLQVKRVAVVVLHLEGFGVTNDCLNSLAAADSGDFDVVLVDNGSTDGSAERLKQEHPGLVLLRSKVNAGFTGGNNLGINYALQRGYEFILLLNNDTFVASNFLCRLLAHLDAHPSLGAVQPCIFFNHDRKLVWNAGSFYNNWFGWAYTRGLNYRFKKEFGQPGNVDWVTGCAFMVRASVLRSTGLLAENMFLYYEDVDLSFRIKKAGFGLGYVPDSVVYHIAGASGKKPGKEGNILPRIHYYNLRNRIWVLKQYTRWYAWPTVLLANGMYVMALLGYFLIRGRNQKFRAALTALLDGLSGTIAYGETLPAHTFTRKAATPQ